MRKASACCLFGLAASGAILAQPGERRIQLRLTEGTSMAAALSPDRRTLAIDLLGSLWTLPASGGAARRITDESLDARQPAWSPDGRRIAFQAYRLGTWNIWSIAADGVDPKPLTSGPYDDREPHWSPDASRIVLSSDRSGNYDIWELALSSGELRQVTRHPANDFMPAWSPDGRTIAFVSDRRDTPGVWEIEDGAERLVAAAQGSVNGPSWSPDGTAVAFNAIAAGRSRLLLASHSGAPERGGGSSSKDLTAGADEDIFPFRPQWISGTEILYTADGKIKRRPIAGGASQAIEFSADISFTRPAFVPKRRAFPPTGPQPVAGVMHPAISPDGRDVAFAAVGDLWVTRIGSAPQRITNDTFVETEPAWSPDGRWLAYSSDRAGSMDLWLRDLRNASERRLTNLPGAELSAAWSPDASRLAFLNSDGEVLVSDIQDGEIKKIHDRLLDPGRPSWSSDGRAIVVAVLRPYSTRFREGTNQILRISLDGQPDRHFDPVPHRSAGAREDYGPVWSPDGRQMAVVIDGRLATLPVDRDGRPVGPPSYLTSELANSPTWTADSRRILYQADDRLKIVDVEDGRVQETRLNLTWAPKAVAGQKVIHAGRLFDGRTNALQDNIDIVIDGNRIRRVEKHRAELHSGTVVDASSDTVVPGLIESHSHLAKGFGESLGRIWLSFGVTTVRSPAANPFEAVEDREAVEAGVRIGPRVFTTGAPFDGTRIYYAGGASLESLAQLDLQLERARRLGFDLIKTYVRLPDPLQKRVIEYAHRHGMPVTSHELYPAVAYGADGVEHIRGTSRRGYSPKVTALNRSYRDVIELLTASKMTLTPTIGIQGGFQLLTLRDPSWIEDARIQTLFPPGVARSGRATLEQQRGADLVARAAALKPLGQTVLEVVKGGGRVVAGTDAPIVPFGLSLLTELEHYVEGGLTPFQALQAATIVPAEALGMGADLGSIEPGKLADLVIIDGNPLGDIRHLRRVRRVVKDGELFELEALLRGPARATSPSAGAREGWRKP